jgi:hypothetical protein
MSGDREPGPRIYRIRIEGRLDDRWSDWFSGLTITYETESDGDTVTTLRGPIADQAALRGALSRLWDLNLTLISVRRLEVDGKEEHEK